MNYLVYQGHTRYAIGTVVKSGNNLYIACENGPIETGFNYWRKYQEPTYTPKGNILKESDL